MSLLDLSESFVHLVNKRDQEKPDLNLAASMGKVNIVLTTYAEALNIPLARVAVLQVCVDHKNLHPHLIKHIESLPLKREYKGQHISRIKKLVTNLPWNEDENPKDHGSTVVEKQLPKHLSEIWFLLSRVKHIHPSGRLIGAKRAAYDKYRSELPLSENGTAIALALIKVSKKYNISDAKVLFEENIDKLYQTLRLDNQNHHWDTLFSLLGRLKQQVRDHLGYQVEKPVKISVEVEGLLEPLKTQVRTYMERARHGFKSDKHIKKLAIRRYGLDLKQQDEITIEQYAYMLGLGLGYIPREMYGDTLDIRDLLKLEVREFEDDGMPLKELYNPLVDYYREREQNRISNLKEVDLDSSAFRMFISAVGAVAAYNGFLRPRELFMKEYEITLDKETGKGRKQFKKHTFTRRWIDEQIERLRPQFNRIAKEGSFKHNRDGILSREARKNLNLCLFYICFLTLRYLGVRQQSVRNCVFGINKSKYSYILWKRKNVNPIFTRINISHLLKFYNSLYSC